MALRTMAVSRVSAVRSILRSRLNPAASSLHKLPEFGAQIDTDRERRQPEWTEYGLATFMRGPMATFIRTKPHMNMGTIGHVDHGETTLTKAISRVLSESGNAKAVASDETDKAPEEKARGNTVATAWFENVAGSRHVANIGFAGHYDHLKNVLSAGAYGGFSTRMSSPSLSNQGLYPFAATGFLNAGGKGWVQHVRTIMVEVKRNDLDRAIRQWRRKCKEENLKSLKDRDYYRKPSEKRVLALKERDRRIVKRAFKQKLNWIMGRRQRGF